MAYPLSYFFFSPPTCVLFTLSFSYPSPLPFFPLTPFSFSHRLPFSIDRKEAKQDKRCPALPMHLLVSFSSPAFRP